MNLVNQFNLEIICQVLQCTRVRTLTWYKNHKRKENSYQLDDQMMTSTRDIRIIKFSQFFLFKSFISNFFLALFYNKCLRFIFFFFIFFCSLMGFKDSFQNRIVNDRTQLALILLTQNEDALTKLLSLFFFIDFYFCTILMDRISLFKFLLIALALPAQYFISQNWSNDSLRRKEELKK